MLYRLQPTISVIVPAYLEGDALTVAISTAVRNARSPEHLEIVAAVVDDATAARLATAAPSAGLTPVLGAGAVPTLDDNAGPAHVLRIVRSRGGRGAALNAGADVAGGDILLFLHADVLLPQDWDVLVRCDG